MSDPLRSSCDRSDTHQDYKIKYVQASPRFIGSFTTGTESTWVCPCSLALELRQYCELRCAPLKVEDILRSTLLIVCAIACRAPNKIVGESMYAGPAVR